MHVCLFVAIALSLQEAEKKSKSQPSSSSLYPSVSNVGSASTSAVKNREPRKVMFSPCCCYAVFVSDGSQQNNYDDDDDDNSDNDSGSDDDDDDCLDADYIRQGCYVMPGICLFLCLFVRLLASLCKNY